MSHPYSTEAGVVLLAARFRPPPPAPVEPYQWECWCGRVLGCPAALDAHQADHMTDEITDS